MSIIQSKSELISDENEKWKRNKFKIETVTYGSLQLNSEVYAEYLLPIYLVYLQEQ